MALFDKLKEKVSNAVNVDKLKETINKTASSVKSEVAKAIDPSIREKELQEEREERKKRMIEKRLQEERELQEKKEQKRLQKEKELKERQEKVREFFESVNIDEELDFILSVLEKNAASAENFEKGINNLINKTGTTLSKNDLLPTMQKELFRRAFTTPNSAAAISVAMDYFIWFFVKDTMNGLFSLYMPSSLSQKKGVAIGDSKDFFIKALYGIAGRAMNYRKNGYGQESYRKLAPEDFMDIIENDNALKSYTDADPFKADEVRKVWAKDLCDVPLKIIESSKVGFLFENEDHIDAAFYFAYMTLCLDCGENADEEVSVSKIARVYLDCLNAYYRKIMS